MLRLYRHNAWTRIEGLSPALRERLHWCLAVHLETDVPSKGVRFGRIWMYSQKWYGSMLHDAHEGDPDRVPAGLTRHVAWIAQQQGEAVEVYDARLRPRESYPWHSMQQLQWRPYQDEVHAAILEHGTGVIVASPRAGKTAMAARALDVLGKPAVCIAPSVPIVRQTYETFCRMFGEKMVARLDGQATEEQRQIHRPIVVATVASAIRQSESWWQTREALILDEVHHAASNSWHEINDLAKHIYHRLGFTGTYFRTGNDDLAMHAVTGDVIYQIGVRDLVAQGYLAAPKVFFRNYKAPRVSDGPWHDLYERGIVKMESRNRLVVSTAEGLMERGDRIIVLTRRRNHADVLGSMIANSVVVKGGEGALTSDAVRDFLRGRHQVLVGTTVIGEGVDVPAASALIYASGGSDGVQLIQSYFRPMTRHADKPTGRIYDFVDTQHRLLDKHSTERMDAAREHLGNENVFTY